MCWYIYRAIVESTAHVTDMLFCKMDKFTFVVV